MSSNPPVIQLKEVTKTYYLGEEAVPAVTNVTLDIKAKEYIGILGASGSGKSTLMYLMGLLETPTSGTIKLTGKDVSHLDDDQLSIMRNGHIGFVFQQFNLINKYTVIENITLPAKYHKQKLDFDPYKRAMELMETFGIAHRAQFFPNKISGGEQQRVAIARALIMNPNIVFADEPTGNLDSKTGEEILKLIEGLNHDFGTTVVVVTHEPDVAKRTQRKIYMKDGHLADSL